MSKRFGEFTKNNTKCMVQVNGVRLIDRLLAQLSKLNIDRIVIVVGYEGQKLMDYVGTEFNGIRIEYVDNPIYDYLVNPYFRNSRIIDEIEANFRTLIAEYPSGMKVNTLLASKCWGVKEDYIIPGNGAAELIQALKEYFEVGEEAK